MTSHQKYFFIPWLLFLFLLAGCTDPVPGHFPTPGYSAGRMLTGAGVGAAVGSAAGSIPVGTAVGGTIGGIWGLYENSNTRIIKHLEHHNVQVVEIGDTVRINLSTDRCFGFESKHIHQCCYYKLNYIAALLKRYLPAHIYITAFTDNVGSPCYLKELADRRADAIVNYFWIHGIPFHCMTPLGRGHNCPIATNRTVCGSAMNRHIEIRVWRCNRGNCAP